MNRLPDIDRRVIDLISGEIELYTVEILTRQDEAMIVNDRMTIETKDHYELTKKIQLQCFLEYQAMIRRYWDQFTWEEQIVFCKYFYQQELLLPWMDDVQITALRLMS